MLRRYKPALRWTRRTYHLQGILVNECFGTFRAVKSCVMIRSLHVLVGRQLRVESPVTGLTLKLRLPMSCVVHVLICRTSSKEPSIARVTLELRLPMSRIIHMLICRALTTILPIACVAFKSWSPVVECIHVLYGCSLAAKLPIASLAFVVIVHVELDDTFVCRRLFR
jgi:hypothetical protein